jgi:hypothetical protein
MRTTDLDRQWQDLMSLCTKEIELSARSHPRLLRLIAKEIERVASEMGFAEALIERREFRAVREGKHISRIITS